MKKIKNYLALVNPFLVYFLIVLIVTVVVAIINSLLLLVLDSNELNTININLIFDILGQLLSYIASIVIFTGWYKKLNRMEMKIKREKSFIIKNIGLIVLLALSFRLLEIGFMSLILSGFEKMAIEHNKLMDRILDGNPIIVMLKVVILAPITEELICRGVIFGKARALMPFLAANIVQAAIFAFFHMNLIQGIYTFGMGLLLGYVTYKYKSILPSILFHMLSNLFGGLGFPLKASYINFIGLAIIGTLLLFVLIKKVSSIDKNIGNEPKFQNS